MRKKQEPVPQYEQLAVLVGTPQRNPRQPIQRLYSELASAIWVDDFRTEAFERALKALFVEIGERTGRTADLAPHLWGAGFSPRTDPAWLLQFLVERESQGRYNVTLQELCVVAAEALTAYHGLEKVRWIQRYAYAAPPDLARRVQVPA